MTRLLVSFALSPQAGFLFSANGAFSIIAWGNAPGFSVENEMSAESAIQPLFADHVEAALSALLFNKYISRRGELGMTARRWR